MTGSFPHGVARRGMAWHDDNQRLIVSRRMSLQVQVLVDSDLNQRKFSRRQKGENCVCVADWRVMVS